MDEKEVAEAGGTDEGADAVGVAQGGVAVGAASHQVVEGKGPALVDPAHKQRAEEVVGLHQREVVQYFAGQHLTRAAAYRSP